MKQCILIFVTLTFLSELEATKNCRKELILFLGSAASVKSLQCSSKLGTIIIQEGFSNSICPIKKFSKVMHSPAAYNSVTMFPAIIKGYIECSSTQLVCNTLKQINDCVKGDQNLKKGKKPGKKPSFSLEKGVRNGYNIG